LGTKALVPSRAHVTAEVVGARVLVTGVNFAIPTEFVQVHGIADILEFFVVVESCAGRVSPLFFGNQQSESHVFIGVRSTILTDTIAIRINLPVH
jgi:hypothetical protein